MFQLKPVAGLLILHSVKCTLISYQSLTGWVIREWNKTILKRLPIQASERIYEIGMGKTADQYILLVKWG